MRYIRGFVITYISSYIIYPITYYITFPPDFHCAFQRTGKSFEDAGVICTLHEGGGIVSVALHFLSVDGVGEGFIL